MISAIAFCCAAAGMGASASPLPANAVAPRAIVNLVIGSPYPFNRISGQGPLYVPSDSLRQLDRRPATSTDGRSQYRVPRGPGRARRPGGVAMLELVGAERGNVGGELGVVVAELIELALIVAVDFGLDRVGAGERRFLGHQRRHRAQREA